MTDAIDKVAADGTWSPFAGWSVLFDQVDDISIAHRVATSTSPLAELARRLADPDVVALPLHTLHVTVCDGINPTVLRRAIVPDPPELGDPAGLPAELDAAVARLVRTASPGLDFTLDGVEIRGRAIVASLRPVDRRRGDLLSAARTAVLDEIRRLLGVRPSGTWRPHVTLGYVRPGRTPSRAGLSDLAAGLDGVGVATRGAGRYEFTTMVDWRRRTTDADDPSP
jgi:hypothetical protein